MAMWPPCGRLVMVRRSRWVEKDLIGGTCLNRGCIPTKALLASSEALAKARAGEEYGFEVAGDVRPDLPRMMARKDRVVTTLRDSVEVLLKRAKVEVVRGTGRLSPGLAVSVDTGTETRTVEADKIIIATGSEPARLPMFDFGHPAVLTSTSALELEKIPESLLIVGAGVIGCEFASFFAELGTKDHHGGDASADASARRQAHRQAVPGRVSETRHRHPAQDQGGDHPRNTQMITWSRPCPTAPSSLVEKILVSVGRSPNSRDIGLEEAGVKTDARGYVIVDDRPGHHGTRHLRHRRCQRGHDAGPRGLVRGLRGGGQLPGHRADSRPAFHALLHLFSSGSGERGAQRGAGGRERVPARDRHLPLRGVGQGLGNG